jgi:hypothetical protein
MPRSLEIAMPDVVFAAPWNRSLKITTFVGTVALAFLTLCGFALLPKQGMGLALTAAPVVILLWFLLGGVRGYVLSEEGVEVKRFGRDTLLPLAGLQSIEGKADAMRGAIRLLANGGVFSYTGFFWNRELKLFRAYATDPSRAVILRYARRRVVVTPHDPQQFIMRARTFLKTAAFPSN